MRLLSDIANKQIIPAGPRMVHAIQMPFVVKYLDSPVPSNEMVCEICGGTNGQTCLIDPSSSDRVIWFCLEPHCMAMVKQSRPMPSQDKGLKKRAILWPLWCEINGIGDSYREGVRFEDIQQSQAKIDYLSKFADAPQGIAIMQGPAGSGKTYAAMATCELFTRDDGSCLFFTQKQLADQWQANFNSDKPYLFREKIYSYALLVVDDFGTKDPTPGFLEFFMDVINTRMQWKRRGTIITTNLDDKNMAQFCGSSLSDRLNTGQKLIFTGKTKRKPPI